MRKLIVLQGVASVTVLVILAVLVLLAPYVSPYVWDDVVGGVWDPVSMVNWLGTDNLGRDMYSRLLYAGRVTLFVALASTVLSLVIGTTVGLFAAVKGGWVDTVLSRLVDAMMSIPTLIFALVILSILGTSTPVLIATIAVLDSTRVFRLTRAMAADIVVLEYFEAALLRRDSVFRLMFVEVLPNILSAKKTEFGLRFCNNFLEIASLSFLGMGIQPPLTDWGSMVRDNATIISFGGIAPLIPATAIAVVTIAVNLIVDWTLESGSRHAQ
ncbi:MAG: ABC transporter permease [Methylobacteriaceae bacterium]|jgi:peptide/nickel transport system permease protein|nr:ABC transporter permease [Methylobacteriaceae bacterium]